MESIFVTARSNGERADAMLSRESGLSRNMIVRLIEQGAVTLTGSNGVTVIQKNYRVTEGEVFRVTLPDLSNPAIKPENIPLSIVFEDSDVIVIDKPRGMVVHPAPGHPDGTLVNALLFHCGESLSGIGGERRPGIVHRLDKDTSGLIAVAKNDFAHLGLSSQLSDRSLTRVYEAVVCGRMRDDNGTVSATIGRDTRDRKRMSVNGAAARGAVTHYEVITRYDGYTHVRCRLETGRTHQIRVHMTHIGHPILGDLVYGRKKPEKGLAGQCLHAARLKFIHPRSGLSVELECPLPDYFSDALKRL